MEKQGIVFAALLSLFSFAGLSSEDCPVPDTFKGIQCFGTFAAENMEQLEEYRRTRGLADGKLRNLLIGFDIETGSLSVSTPCRITVGEGATVETTGDGICLTGLKGVTVGASAGLAVPKDYDIGLYSDGPILIGENADIRGGDVKIVSSASGGTESKVTFGGRATVEAENLTAHSHSQTTVGADSKIDVDNKLFLLAGSLKSPGDYSSGVRKDPVSTSNPLYSLHIKEGAHIDARTAFLSSKYHTSIDRNARMETWRYDIDSTATNVHDGAELTEYVQRDDSYPRATFTAEESSDDPLTFTFRGSVDSLGEEKDITSTWMFGKKLEVDHRTKEPEATYTFDYPGIYLPTLTVADRTVNQNNTVSEGMILVKMPSIKPFQMVTLHFEKEGYVPETVHATLGNKPLR